MRSVIAGFLAVLLTPMAVLFAQPAPLLITVNSRAESAPQLQLFQASPRTIRASFVDGTNVMDLSSTAISNCFLTWSTTSTSATYAASSPVYHNGTNGQVDFTFAASNLNYTPGRYIYEVGIGSTVVRQGVLLLLGSPFASGADPITWSTSVNWGVINWVGIPDFVEDTTNNGTIYGRSNGTWVAIAGAAVGTGATNASGAGRLSLSYTAATRTVYGSVDVSGLATGTPLYVETGTGTLVAASIANMATGTPLYVEVGTGTLVAASLAGYATGTPLYVETGTGTLVAASLAGYATGTPVYVDLGATSASGAGRLTLSYTAATKTVYGTVDVSGLATGTPLYVEAGTGTLVAASLAGFATGTPIYSLSGTLNTGTLFNSSMISGTGTNITNNVGSITSQHILDETVANADIATNAAILMSKIAGLPALSNAFGSNVVFRNGGTIFGPYNLESGILSNAALLESDAVTATDSVTTPLVTWTNGGDLTIQPALIDSNNRLGGTLHLRGGTVDVEDDQTTGGAIRVYIPQGSPSSVSHWREGYFSIERDGATDILFKAGSAAGSTNRKWVGILAEPTTNALTVGGAVSARYFFGDGGGITNANAATLGGFATTAMVKRVVINGVTNFPTNDEDFEGMVNLGTGFVTRTGREIIRGPVSAFSNFVSRSDAEGSELVSNGGFTGSETSWATTALVYSANAMLLNSGNSGAITPSNAITIVAGKTYNVEFVLSQAATVTVTTAVGGHTNSYSFAGSSSDNVTNSFEAHATSTQNLVIAFAAAGGQVKLDGVSVKPRTEGTIAAASDLFVGGNFYVAGGVQITGVVRSVILNSTTSTPTAAGVVTLTEGDTNALAQLTTVTNALATRITAVEGITNAAAGALPRVDGVATGQFRIATTTSGSTTLHLTNSGSASIGLNISAAATQLRLGTGGSNDWTFAPDLFNAFGGSISNVGTVYASAYAGDGFTNVATLTGIAGTYQSIASFQAAQTNYARWLGNSAPASNTASGSHMELRSNATNLFLYHVGSGKWFRVTGAYEW